MLSALWRVWLVIAKKIGHLQSFLVLTLFYFIVMMPFALAVRLFSDPLGLRETPSWRRLSRGRGSAASLDAMRAQSWGSAQ